MKYLTVLFFLVGLWPSYGEAAKVAKVIAIEYPPYVSEYAEGNGVSVALLRERLARAGWQLSLRFYPPARASSETSQTDRWELSFFPPQGDTTKAPVNIGDASIHYSFFRLKKPEPFKWSNLSELRGKTLITIRPLSNSVDNDTFTRAGLKLVFVNSIEQGFRILASGRADYLITAEETGWFYLEKSGLNLNDFQFAQTSLRTYNHSIYMNEASPHYAELYQALTAKK